MAKIKVFSAAKKLMQDTKELMQDINELDKDIDSHMESIKNIRSKLEQEEKERAEREKREKELEEKRKVLRLEQARQKEEEKNSLQAERKEREMKKTSVDNQNISENQPNQNKGKHSTRRNKRDSRSENNGQERKNQVSAKKDTGRREEEQKRSQKFSKHNKSDDIIEQFLSQPPVTIDKGEVNKNMPSKGYSEKIKIKQRKNKKEFWQGDEAIFFAKNKKDKPKNQKKNNDVSQTSSPKPPERKKAITMGEVITVKELSEKIGISVAEIIKNLMNLGVLATINQELDYETAALVASEFNIELEKKATKSYEEILIDEDIEDNPEDLVQRPPVVTVMGHVDHGKTSLLDAIRNTNVTQQEAGGITQHIGAYTVDVDGKLITFLDTPGHEAFTTMRARGAQVTDIAVLVVAANDGVMPQTIEAINHAKEAKVPIIVAINKIDIPDANPERVKQELAEQGLIVEEWGGDTIAVEVSALKKQGIENLLDMILLVAEMQELKANPKRLAKGTIIEAELDKGRGPVATILVQNGTLHVGDSIVAGTAYGRVRAMMNYKGQRIKKAGPSIPVQVLGLSDVPEAGDTMYAVEDDKLAKQVAEERKEKLKEQQLKASSKMSLDELFNKIKEGEVKELNIIVKADVQGSVEAVRQSLEKLSNDEVRVRVIHGAVGAITESDIMLASASNAIVVGFNVRPSAATSELAEKEGVDIRLYRVIYSAIEDIEAAMKGMLEPEYKEVVTGHAEVRAIFRVSGVGTVAGCYVTDGKINRNNSARLIRDGIVVFEGNISSLKRFKDDVREVASGYECGLGLQNYNDIKEGDVIETFTIEEIKR